MSFAVVESEIEDVWAKNSAISYNIVELTENKIRLKDESGLVTVWTRTDMGKTVESEGNPALSIPMAPVVVNINKNRANDKDRYLCLKMNIKLKELMPDEKPPPVHSKIHDAVITFFSSLLYDYPRHCLIIFTILAAVYLHSWKQRHQFEPMHP